MTLRQSFFVPPVPFLIANELGLLSEAGVEVESQRTRSSGEQLEGFKARQIDLAITAMDNVFVWNTLGVNVRIAAQVEQTTLLSVYAVPGTRSLSDLDHGRFAVDALANGFALVARRMLEDAGVTATLLEVGGVKERLDALVAGAADGTLLGPPLDELAERAGMVRIASANETFPALPGQGIVVGADRTDAQTAELRSYLAVLDQAIKATATMSDSEGVAFLERNGFPGRSAMEAWRTRPRTTAIDPDGLALVESLRDDFGLLPRGYEGLESILDHALIPRA